MIVVAVPTIEERGDAWKEVEAVWYETAPKNQAIICVPSWRKGGWVQGLNEVWEQAGDVAEVFICASDDMTPEPGWFEAIQPYLSKGVIACQMVNHPPEGGVWKRFGPEVRDGDGTDMSSFPILSKHIACQVFPLPAESPQHYYADNYISDLARKAGFTTVAVPSCVIVHKMDERGRGAGMGSEDARMQFDRQVYRKAVRQ